jgi:hypothetical protein
MTCSKCSVHLQEGFLLETTRNSRTATQWVEGMPVTSFWTGLRLKGRTRLPVIGYRCPRCGLLELYAPAGSGEAR